MQLNKSLTKPFSKSVRWCKDCGAINAIEHLGRDLAWFRCKCINKRVGD